MADSEAAAAPPGARRGLCGEVRERRSLVLASRRCVAARRRRPQPAAPTPAHVSRAAPRPLPASLPPLALALLSPRTPAFPSARRLPRPLPSSLLSSLYPSSPHHPPSPGLRSSCLRRLPASAPAASDSASPEARAPLQSRAQAPLGSSPVAISPFDTHDLESDSFPWSPHCVPGAGQRDCKHPISLLREGVKHLRRVSGHSSVYPLCPCCQTARAHSCG